MTKSKIKLGEGPLYTISNYICWFFLGNLYFLLLNIPMVFILLILLSNGAKTIPQGFSILIILCCIPIAPAATALFSVMGKLLREKDINITRDFFKAYKINFLQSLFLGALELLVINILFIDIRFLIANGYPRILTISAYTIVGFILLMNLYVFPITSRFYLSWKDTLKNAMYYTIKKFNITFMCFCSFLIVGYILFKVTTLIFVFMSSIICFSIMYYQQKVLLEIENKIKKNNEKIQE